MGLQCSRGPKRLYLQPIGFTQNHEPLNCVVLCGEDPGGPIAGLLGGACYLLPTYAVAAVSSKEEA